MAVEFGPFALDLARCELRRDGRVVAVQRKVFDLLAYLVEHPDRLVSRKELLERVWQGTVVSPISINRTVTQARRVLEDCGQDPRWIATVHGRGYRFVGELRRHDSQEPGPREAVAARLAPLPERTRRALAVASVLGLGFSTRLLATLLEERLAPVLAALDEAVRGGILMVSSGERLEHAFVAPLDRVGLYESLRPDRVAALHWRAAVALEAEWPAPVGPEQIAEHYLACASAEGRARALHYLVRAGNRAAERLEHDAALRLSRRALDLRASLPAPSADAYPLRCDLLLRIAHQTLLAGRSAAAAEIGSAAWDEARALGDPARIVEATLGLWTIFAADSAVLDVARARALLEYALSVCSSDALLARARLHACLTLLELDEQPRSAAARGAARARYEASEGPAI